MTYSLHTRHTTHMSFTMMMDRWDMNTAWGGGDVMMSKYHTTHMRHYAQDTLHMLNYDVPIDRPNTAEYKQNIQYVL